MHQLTNLNDPILSTGHNTELFVWIRKSKIIDTPSMSFNLNHKNLSSGLVAGPLLSMYRMDKNRNRKKFNRKIMSL